MEEKNIIVEISTCKHYLQTLTSYNNTESGTSIVTWFQQLCDYLGDLLTNVTYYIKKKSPPLLDKSAKEMILLYLLQLTTHLSVLIKIFVQETKSDVIITEGRHCITKQIITCLDGLEDVLTNKKFTHEVSTSFVKYMDIALDKIAEIDIDNGRQEALNVCGEARSIIEEVLCHGMSIAQVALIHDCNSIKGGSKEVLNTLESLATQINLNNPNNAMCNLFIDSCCDKLCALERKVNTAVLKLSLRVFSECTKPLDDLYKYCLEAKERNDVELDNVIADFDLHVDRLIQVGLFAVACSTDTNCTLKMRSCLASLEALEGELVPAFNTMHSDPTSHNINFANVLMEHWINQAKSLKNYIYLIIDPYAFAQVTLEVVKELNECMEESFKESRLIDNNMVRQLTLQVNILIEMIIASCTECPTENIESVKKYVQYLKDIMEETNAAANVLLGEDASVHSISRVIKRCKIHETGIKKLLLSLGADLEMKTNYSINKENICVTINRNKNEQVMENNQFIDHIINRGKQILKDRSVLYKTPIKGKFECTSAITGKRKLLPLSKLVHLRNMQFSHSRIGNETSIDLQITDILENLTTMSNSFQ